jgi:hypothetical protein
MKVALRSIAGQFTLVAAGAILALAFLQWERTSGEDKKVTAPRLYELRTYTTLEGRLPALHARFKNHTMRLFEKHGMRNEMYWVPTDEKLKDNTLIYVVSHASADAAKKSWEGFIGDPEWAKVRDESEKDGKIVAKVERVYMNLVDYSPGAK